MATQEEIEALKENWKRDPIWDIEDTEDFQDHYQELLQWRKEYELEFQQKEEDRITRRLRAIELVTGVTNADVGQAISTYSEIESMATRSNKDGDRLGIEAAQVSATLLLAAQVQRIADLIEAQIESDLRSFYKLK